jgi:hypothetical protein
MQKDELSRLKDFKDEIREQFHTFSSIEHSLARVVLDMERSRRFKERLAPCL